MKRIGTRLAACAAGAQLMTGCVVAAGSSGDGTGASFFFLLLPFALLLLMASLAGRRHRATRRRRPAPSAAESTNEQMLRAELSVLADDVIRLEPRVALNEAARDDYEAATHRYRVAHAALDHADEPIDLVRVQRVVDEASWSMARARAVVEGRPPPAPPRPLQRPGNHGEPAVGVDDARRPVYVDSPATFRSGWFGAGGGLFGGLLLGSFLSQGWMVEEHVDEAEDGDPDGW